MPADQAGPSTASHRLPCGLPPLVPTPWFLLPRSLTPPNLRDAAQQVADFVPIQLRHNGYAMDVSQQVLRVAKEHAARGLAIAAAQQMAVRSRDQFDQRRSGRGLRQQAAENRPEMISDLHATTRALHVTTPAGFRIATASCHPRTVRPENFTGFTALPIARAPAGSENAS